MEDVDNDVNMETESNLANGYLDAYKIACGRLGESMPDEICLNTNAVYHKDSNLLCLKYLNKDYLVDCGTGGIKPVTAGMDVPVTVKVLMLHYLINATGRPLSGKMISFKEIPGGGAIYYRTFYKRAVVPLVKTFENDFAGLYKAALKLGGVKEEYGHACVTLKVFPLVPVTYVLWQGDDEIPSSGTILFDDSVTSFLPGEDIVLAASFGVYEMIRLAKTG